MKKSSKTIQQAFETMPKNALQNIKGAGGIPIDNSTSGTTGQNGTAGNQTKKRKSLGG